MLQFQLFWKVDTMICHKYAITNCFYFLCIFITNDDINDENLDLYFCILTISTMDMVSQSKEFLQLKILITIDVRYLYVDIFFNASKDNRVS